MDGRPELALTEAQRLDEAFDQLDNVDAMCDLFYRFKKFTIYKAIGVSLRFMLTGSSGDQGLIQQVLPAVRLSLLRVVRDSSLADGHLKLPTDVVIVGSGRIHLAAGVGVQNLNVAGGAVQAMTCEDPFNGSGATLDLPAWLEQPFLRPEWTLSDFIRVIANKDGGAHLESNQKLLAMKKWGYLHWHLTAGVGRGLLPQLRTQLVAAYPNHIRAIR